jgi:hypothetical protein
MVMKIQFIVFCLMTPCSDVVILHLLLPSTLFPLFPWCHNLEDRNFDIRTSVSLDPVLVHTFTPYFFKVSFNSILSSVPRPP